MSALQPFRIIGTRNIVGEGILWHARQRQLWWTDIQGRKLHCYNWAGEALTIHETPERVGSFAFVAGSDRLIVAFASGIAWYDVHSQKIEWLARPQQIVSGVRFNDGRVDRRGRFWSGTMVEGAQHTADGCLYSLGRSGLLQCHARDIRISNGLCMSLDGTRLYFADSAMRTIYEYEMIEPEGRLGARRIFTTTPEGAYPDGAAVDAEGCVWSAHWGAGCLVRYMPDGRIDRTITVPTCQPSCVCFAGPDLDVLCVTSARENLSESVLQSEPHAGAVFLYRAGIRGLAEPEYLP